MSPTRRAVYFSLTEATVAFPLEDGASPTVTSKCCGKAVSRMIESAVWKELQYLRVRDEELLEAVDLQRA